MTDTLLIILTIGLAVLVPLVIYVDSIEPDEIETRVESSIPIASLKLSSEIKGNYSSSFLFGSAEIQGITYYKFYKVTEQGNLKFCQLRADSVDLKQSNTENPALITYQKYKLYKSPKKIWFKGEEEMTQETNQVLIIPTTAIEIKYDANL